MLKFILRNNLYLMAALGLGVAIYLALNWSSTPVLQRMTGLFFIALVMHLWEEGRFPAASWRWSRNICTSRRPTSISGEVDFAVLVLIIGFVPLFFPHVPFLAMAAMILGLLEAVAHVAVIRIFRLKHFYSPGMVTAVVVLLPISLYTISYAVRWSLMSPGLWLLSLLYFLFGFVVAQQIIIRASGMKYSEFLGNVKKAFLH